MRRAYANLFLERRDAARPFHVGLLLENRPEFVLARARRGAVRRRDRGPQPDAPGRAAGARHRARRLPDRAHRGALRARSSPSAGRARCPGADRARRRDVAARRAGDAAGPRPGRSRRPRRPGAADLHLGHDRRPEGRAAQPRQARADGARRRVQMCQATADDVVLLRHAAVPLERADPGDSASRWRPARRLVLCAPLLRARLPARRPPVRRARSSTTSASRSPTSWRRPSDPTTPTTRCASRSATRRRASTSTRFARRFGCRVVDGYGSTEGGVPSRAPTATRPARSASAGPGRARSSTRPGKECAPARFDAHGRLRNAEEAIGEIVNTAGAGRFEGYYNNPEATAERTRGGKYLDRRPRLPRRAGLLLLRRARRRVAARRRRELPGRAGRGRSCSAIPTSCSRRSTACPTPRWATR